ncbi:hypothetical protein [Enterococcus sp. DIV0187]|uniref:hypothetical protein n=1 Tax=Enterococcus sp. DIV0187 TaxID=2774644 RepID=UPI003F25F73D
MSTTSKIKEELIRLLNEEENKAGLTFSEVWDKLEQTDFKEELYNDKKEKRIGCLVGLSTRIRKGKIQGLKILKNSSNELVFVSSSNEIDYLMKLTEKFVKDTTNIQVKTDNYSKEKIEVIEGYNSLLEQLKQYVKKLEKVSSDVEIDKILENKKQEKENVKPKKIIGTSKKEISKIEVKEKAFKKSKGKDTNSAKK